MKKHESNKNGPVVLIMEGQMRTRTIYAITLMAGLFLITSCTVLTDSIPTSTPDILLMDIYERTIWDFENLRNEIHDLAAVAADTPVEDLEPILHQMASVTEEIEVYEFPLSAVQAHSALYNFSALTVLCYQREYVEYLRENSGEESVGEHIDFCGQAQVFEETLDLYLQELNEMIAAK